MIILKNDAVGIEIDDKVNSLFNDIKNHSFNKTKIILAAKLNNHNLYGLCDINSIHNYSSSQIYFLTSVFASMQQSLLKDV